MFVRNKQKCVSMYTRIQYLKCVFLLFLYNHCVNTLIPLFSRVRTSRCRQIVGSRPRIKTRHYDHFMDRSIKVTRLVEKVFEPYSMIYKEMKGEKNWQLPTRFCETERDIKNSKTSLSAVRSDFADFRFPRVVFEPTPLNRNECGHIYVHIH